MYVCTNVLSLFLGYLFLPETKDRTLEDIDAIFMKANNWLQPVRIAKIMPEGFAEEMDLSEKNNMKADQIENTA